jgi:hypothetical protein
MAGKKLSRTRLGWALIGVGKRPRSGEYPVHKKTGMEAPQLSGADHPGTEARTTSSFSQRASSRRVSLQQLFLRPC